MATKQAVKSDSSFKAKCRFLQLKYRADILKEKCGVGPYKKSIERYGNYLINGELTGSNFLTEGAFEHAHLKVREKTTP